MSWFRIQNNIYIYTYFFYIINKRYLNFGVSQNKIRFQLWIYGRWCNAQGTIPAGLGGLTASV